MGTFNSSAVATYMETVLFVMFVIVDFCTQYIHIRIQDVFQVGMVGRVGNSVLWLWL